MLEIAMVTTLALMGIYFFKSTDLPKDMKERSAQNRVKSQHSENTSSKKFAIQNVIIKETESQKLFDIKKQEREAMIALHINKIDELTFLITTLEQQIKENNSRNAEIQAQINLHMESLEILKKSKIA